MTKKVTKVPTKKAAAEKAGGDSLLTALQAYVRAEVDARLQTFGPATAKGSAAPPGNANVDLQALGEQLISSGALKTEINNCLEQGLRSVLPQMISRLRKDLTDGAGGGETNVKAVVNSSEMKEMIEDQFRTMLLYLKQEVIPKELQKHGVRS